jgi:hypothetical protein
VAEDKQQNERKITAWQQSKQTRSREQGAKKRARSGVFYTFSNSRKQRSEDRYRLRREKER